MSAINVLVQSQSVHVLTDGAAYQADGSLVAIGPKARLMPHQSCIVAMRGPWAAWAPIAEEIAFAAQSFEELRDRIVPLLKACRAHYASLFESCSSEDFEIIVGGIDGAGKPAAYMVPSHDRYGNEPWNVLPLDGLVCLPNEPTLAETIAAITEGCCADDLDPERDGVSIMEAQRAFTFDPPCIVGGFAQLSTVTADGVSSRIIRRWQQ